MSYHNPPPQYDTAPGIKPHTFIFAESKGVYPQSNGSLAIVNIDASKGFVDLWVHLSFAIFANFDVKKQLKWLSTKI